MGCLMKIYRDWQLGGDDDLLRALWPAARRALEFCWIPGGWDADRDGVMEGCQHNTMDVEYYGPNPQMGSWYLGALRAAEEMAPHLGDDDFATECRKLFENGSAWIDEHLFNGEYYEHEMRPPASADDIAPGLRERMGAADPTDPELQLGRRLPGRSAGRPVHRPAAGLGSLLDPAHVGTTLRSILKYNGCPGLHGHFNHMRSFALGDESAVLMCSYPQGHRPERPFPYFTEVMTGFEYTPAVGMLYEGLVDEGLTVIADIRARYDGRAAQPVRRGRVRPPLRARDGELGRGPGADRLPLRRPVRGDAVRTADSLAHGRSSGPPATPSEPSTPSSERCGSPKATCSSRRSSSSVR